MSPPARGRVWDRPLVLAGLAMAAFFGIVLFVALLIGRRDAGSLPTAAATASARETAAHATPRPDDRPAAPSGVAGGAGVTARAPGSSAQAPDVATPAPEAIASPTPGPTATAARGRPLAGASGAVGRLRAHRDARYGFEVATGDAWEATTVDTQGAVLPVPGHVVLFTRADSDARMAVSVWDADAPIALERWVEALAPGFAPVDGAGPTNAVIARLPALVLWMPESATAPAQYAAFVRRDRVVYRLAYAAYDGGAALTDFLRLVVSFEWPTPDGGHVDTIDIVPPLPAPPARFFPSID